MAVLKIHRTLTPFLYPSFWTPSTRNGCHIFGPKARVRVQWNSVTAEAHSPVPIHQELTAENLSSEQQDFTAIPFVDTCAVTVQAGAGGHGCIAFHRDVHIADGPPNGGDGGSGGNVFIQAVSSQTSLHKIARRGVLKAGRGSNGRGKGRGGERGSDVIIEVPVGTVVREISRIDPFAIEEEARRERRAARRAERLEAEASATTATTATLDPDVPPSESSPPAVPSEFFPEKWLVYPGTKPSDLLHMATLLPKIPPPRYRRPALYSAQAEAPITLDLSDPNEAPKLLLAGSPGGHGNTHFQTAAAPKPKLATRGEKGTTLSLTLELKLLADVGLVGLPNAGKSTLLRALTNAKARVGHWAFTTLRPNIGTVVLPPVAFNAPATSLRTHLSVADIPGLTVGAHQDKGVGMAFLRHVERARVLVFVVDLADPEKHPVDTIKALWREISMYAQMRTHDEQAVRYDEGETREYVPITEAQDVSEQKTAGKETPEGRPAEVRVAAGEGLLSKPWFVVATKADVEGTQGRYQELVAWLEAVSGGKRVKPQGRGVEAWNGPLKAYPVSAINGEGMPRLVDWMRSLVEVQSDGVQSQASQLVPKLG